MALGAKSPEEAGSCSLTNVEKSLSFQDASGSDMVLEKSIRGRGSWTQKLLEPQILSWGRVG